MDIHIASKKERFDYIFNLYYGDVELNGGRDYMAFLVANAKLIDKHMLEGGERVKLPNLVSRKQTGHEW